MTRRRAGKYGAAPRDHRTWPKLEDYLTAPLPQPPPVVDWMSKVASWPMYANGPDPANPAGVPDGCGDCTFATIGHTVQAWTAYAGTETTLPLAPLLAGYEQVGGYVPGDPSTDQGCQPADVLNYWMDQGVGGHKIDAWATLANPQDPWLLKRCLNLFGSVYLAIQVPQSAEDQFSEGLPWTASPRSPLAGRHAVPLQRFADGEFGCMEVVTWAAVQRMTLRFARQNIIDAYVAYSRDFLEANGLTPGGLDVAQLQQDLAAARCAQ